MPLTIPKYVLSPPDSYSLTYLSNRYADGAVHYSTRFLCNTDKAEINELASLQQEEVRSYLESFHHIAGSYNHRLESWVKTNPAEYEQFLIRLASRFNLPADDARIYNLPTDPISPMSAVHSKTTPRPYTNKYNNARPTSSKALKGSQHNITSVKPISPQLSNLSPNHRSGSFYAYVEQRHYVDRDQFNNALPESVVSLRVYTACPALHSNTRKAERTQRV